jgi:hypothetical protein
MLNKLYYTTLTQTGGGNYETKEISCQAHGSGKEAASGHNEKGEPPGTTDY